MQALSRDMDTAVLINIRRRCFLEHMHASIRNKYLCVSKNRAAPRTLVVRQAPADLRVHASSMSHMNGRLYSNFMSFK